MRKDHEKIAVEKYNALKKQNKKMKQFLEWCVNNWICDPYTDKEYSEEFCGSPDCRRCSAKEILDSN